MTPVTLAVCGGPVGRWAGGLVGWAGGLVGWAGGLVGWPGEAPGNFPPRASQAVPQRPRPSKSLEIRRIERGSGEFSVRIRSRAAPSGPELMYIYTYIHIYSLFARHTIYMFHATRALPVRLHLDSNDTLDRMKRVYSATGDG